MTAHGNAEDVNDFYCSASEGTALSASARLSLELGVPCQRGKSLNSRLLYDEAGTTVFRLASLYRDRYPPRKVTWPCDSLLEDSVLPPCCPTSKAGLRQKVEGPVRCERRLQRSVSLPPLKLSTSSDVALPSAFCAASSKLPSITAIPMNPEAHDTSTEVLSRASSVFNSVEETVIIFDWDDTLFPTWFVSEVVLPCLPEDTMEKAAMNGLAEDCPFLEALTQHATAVTALLRAASAIGRVGIVTLSQRPWVISSATRFLPGLNFERLAKELKIPIVYARESIKRPMVCLAEVEEGVNVFSVAKQRAMLKALKKLYGKAPWRNIMSIGDSRIERDAIKELLWNVELPESDLGPPCCKTVKLMEEPSVEQLGAELGLLGTWLQQMVSHVKDFDIVIDNSEDTMRQMRAMFGSS